ncbi:MAG: hypoxanthine phosphoribosyltransferase [Clostridia bacterium]|nr:hypoxanthine phosphoribosyltransferase [Clostridia bacterium]
MYEHCDKVLVSKEELAEMVKKLGKKISEDYAGKELVVIGVLRGAFIFMADLVRELTVPVKLDFLVAKSYSGTTTTGEVKILKDIDFSVEGKHVLIVEDIIDTGITLGYLKKLFALRNAASVAVCTAFDKPDRRLNEGLEVDYCGMTVPNEFVVGYGLDYNDYMRNIPELRIYDGE